MLVLFVINIAWVSFGAVSPLMGFFLGAGHRADRPGDAAEEPHRAAHAHLQRGPGRHLRRGLRHHARPARPGGGRGLRPLPPQRHHPGRRLARRAGAGGRRARRPRDRRAHLLPPPRAKPAPQGRQHRRLGRALGQRLSLHAGSRRRQPDGGVLHHRAGAPHGGGRHPRHPADRAAAHRRRHAARPRPAVRQPRLRAGAHPWPARLVRRCRQLLGPQRHHPHRGLRRLRRPARAARKTAVRRPHPQPRLRGSRLRAARRLCRAHGRRPAGQLRTRAAQPHRARRTRPPLVPGQPAARAAPEYGGPASAEPAASLHGRDVLSRLAALAALSPGWHVAGPARLPRPARLLPRPLVALPRLAAHRPRARHGALRHLHADSLRAEALRRRRLPARTGLARVALRPASSAS